MTPYFILFTFFCLHMFFAVAFDLNSFPFSGLLKYSKTIWVFAASLWPVSACQCEAQGHVKPKAMTK